jgi:hypothetical protein
MWTWKTEWAGRKKQNEQAERGHTDNSLRKITATLHLRAGLTVTSLPLLCYFDSYAVRECISC